jgi:hypothetical protein
MLPMQCYWCLQAAVKELLREASTLAALRHPNGRDDTQQCISQALLLDWSSAQPGCAVLYSGDQLAVPVIGTVNLLQGWQLAACYIMVGCPGVLCSPSLLVSWTGGELCVFTPSKLCLHVHLPCSPVLVCCRAA